jgi:isopentenyl phosphate kinase
MILVHGAGSFGHILAKKYRLNQGYKQKAQLQGFAFTHATVQELNTLVLQSLQTHGIPAVSLPPHVILTLNDHRPSQMNYTLFKSYLKHGFMPLTFGDVVLDKRLGFSICSGDLLICLLAARFKPEKVIFVIDEDGLYSANPKTTPDAKFIQTATVRELQKLTTKANTHADVTKGMEGKLDTIRYVAKKGIETILVNGNVHNRLYDTLTGKKTRCTVIPGDDL